MFYNATYSQENVFIAVLKPSAAENVKHRCWKHARTLNHSMGVKNREKETDRRHVEVMETSNLVLCFEALY